MDCGLVILPNGDYYERFGACTPCNPEEASGKLNDIVFGEGSDAPKVGNKIIFIRRDETGLSYCGPHQVDRITTDKDVQSGYDIDGAVYDSDGDYIDYDFSSSCADFFVELTAYETYYIYMEDYNEHTGYYILW